MMTFDALLLSLPSGNSTLRMRLWRALKSTGCAVLRDGVYIVPGGAPQAKSLVSVEAEVRKAGGTAMTVELGVRAEQLGQVEALFDRSAEYGELVSRIDTARAGIARRGQRKTETTYQRLKRSFDELSAIDFYPGHARAQAVQALAGLQSALRAKAAGEPRRGGARLRKLDARNYRRRTWATRKDLWVDRLASAWLIKRFVDEDARFVWLDQPAETPRRAVGFDFDGAEFTHAGDRVTFEVLQASFGLESDAGLSAIGAAVHYLDVGGIPVADAKGLESVLAGIKKKARNDDARLREAIRVFDFLYASYAERAEAAPTPT
jgi:hypothetical protein